jgi:hypothetical protein
LLLGVVVASAAVDLKSDGIFLSSITTRRTLLDPGLLTGFYYEHYSQTRHAGLGYHFGGAGENIPAPSYEIGLVYFGDQHIDANANLWAEGFADFGIPGIFGFTLILATLMWLYDSVAARNRAEFAILLITMQAFAFSNSAPLTVAITHGGIAMTILLWCSRFGCPANLGPCAKRTLVDFAFPDPLHCWILCVGRRSRADTLPATACRASGTAL